MRRWLSMTTAGTEVSLLNRLKEWESSLKWRLTLRLNPRAVTDLSVHRTSWVNLHKWRFKTKMILARTIYKIFRRNISGTLRENAMRPKVNKVLNWRMLELHHLY